jgi:hypothetical protein
MKDIQLFILALGIFFSVMSYLDFSSSLDLVQNGQLKKGKVLKVTTKKDDDGDSYSALIKYRNIANKTARFRSSYTSSSKRYFVGQSLYLLENETNVEELRFTSLFTTSLITLAISLSCFVSSIGYFIFLFIIKNNFKLTPSQTLQLTQL